MIERLLKIMMDWKDRKNKKERHPLPPNNLPLVESGTEPSSDTPDFCVSPQIDKIFESQEQVIKASFGHQMVSSLILV